MIREAGLSLRPTSLSAFVVRWKVSFQLMTPFPLQSSLPRKMFSAMVICFTSASSW